MPRLAANWSRVAVAAVFGWSTAILPAQAQAPAGDGTTPAVNSPAAPAAPETQAQPTPPAASAAQPTPPAASAAQAPEQAPDLYTLSELEYLLAPVALYPDPLLAILFPATAFPDQLVAAYTWAKRNPNTARHGDLSALDGKPWDSSVKALTRFPDVLKQLYEHMEWAESLGFAFIRQPQDVSNTIQMLRAQAEKAGNLASTQQQVVSTREVSGQRTIYIAPANPERIYVPVYNPSTVFNTFAAGALGFGVGVLVGSSWNNRWGWNNRGWNTIWVAPPAWRPPPHWGWGPGGQPGPRPPNWGPGHRPPAWGPGQRPPPNWGNGPWRPERPGSGRPEGRPPQRPGGGQWPGNRPGGNRPIINRPEININQPGNSGNIINRPNINRPNVNRPEIPPGANRPNINRPDNRPNVNRPNVNRPDNRPNVKRPNVNRPNAGQNRPASRPNAGQHRPAQRPQAQRPTQRAKPHQNARPRQQGRPHQNARPQNPRRNN
ncbi:DUF3300 domain-containing protein [Xanthobacter agilis]|uniref:DUF3300 domain-containing protein n=1 Tax=Xanthobacter agilis TaxID=47492 RepID=A0ABU0L8R1_XANAG|nr:DUF3300 domain-containing protein [Xanthobacter agilis]MDQ0503477.1 hypothetical protein [Xanthobacter agilis]